YGFAVWAERPDVSDASYWAVARAEGGWRTELAFGVEPGDWMAWCRAAGRMADTVEALGYADRETGDRRLAFFEGDRLVAALFIAREPVAVSRNWAVGQLTEPHGNGRKRFAVVAGRPGADQPDPGATVCACFSVGVNQIVAAAAKGCRTIEAVGEVLKAGTNCGSCRAEIRGILNGLHVAAAE
ncbi:(2Fe-2S)-binding protein, partial [Rhizobium sp. TRM95111]|uniref:(2Fe-2S)-binding protein n=1 Tax=Rhizobium alarense TaxID=2846851 RepID=UPI001F26652D